jgi:hypothetical protein
MTRPSDSDQGGTDEDSREHTEAPAEGPDDDTAAPEQPREHPEDPAEG